jgi:hypothetical protein
VAVSGSPEEKRIGSTSRSVNSRAEIQNKSGWCYKVLRKLQFQKPRRVPKSQSRENPVLRASRTKKKTPATETGGKATVHQKPSKGIQENSKLLETDVPRERHTRVFDKTRLRVDILLAVPVLFEHFQIRFVKYQPSRNESRYDVELGVTVVVVVKEPG